MKLVFVWQQISNTYCSLTLFSGLYCFPSGVINYSNKYSIYVHHWSKSICIFQANTSFGIWNPFFFFLCAIRTSQQTKLISNDNLTLNRRNILATMMETELEEAPITPTTLSGLVIMGAPPPRHLTSVPSFSIRACTKVRDCSKAWVSLEQVSRIRAPSVMLGSRLLSLLMRSRAKSMASSLCIPFSFFSSPHGFPSCPLACTGKSPPKEISPSMRIEFKCVCPGPLGLAAWAGLREV